MPLLCREITEDNAKLLLGIAFAGHNRMYPRYGEEETVCRLKHFRNTCFRPVLGPFVIRVFALTSLANLHHFLICSPSVSV
jgi:hypothetical protein